MRKTTMAIMAAAGVMVAAHGALAGETDPKALAGEAKGIVKGFFKELKGTLVSAMREKGPGGAVDVCHLKAKEITERHNKAGWKVGRTALKLRNPANAPDEWERAVLMEFEKKIAQGADPRKLAKFEIVEQGGRKVFRFMKAIPTGKPCLTCHGEKVAPDLYEKIRGYYPQDKAVGFRLGQLRGAFTLSKPLD